jgi:hypothetical protein
MMDENLIIVDYALSYEIYTVANTNEIFKMYSHHWGGEHIQIGKIYYCSFENTLVVQVK